VNAILADRWRSVGWAMVIAGALLRLVFTVIHPPYNYLYADMAGYVERAQALAAGLRLTPYDALGQPGTHILLAAPLWIFGSGHGGLVAATWLWWFLSSLIPLATWQLARQLVGPRAAALAAALAAFNPLLISYGAYFTSEIPATALLICALALGYTAAARRNRSGIALLALAGLFGGAAVVVRPQLILNLAVFALALRPWLLNRRAIAAFACALALPVAGGIWYSSAARGQLTFIASNGGLNFFQEACSVHVLYLSESPGTSYYFGSPVAAQLNRGTDYYYRGIAPWDEGFFYRRGLECLKRRPLSALADSLRNVADLTATSEPWPQVNEHALGRIADASNILYCGALLCALFALAWWRRRAHQRLPRGIRVLLWQLLLIVPLAMLFSGEPRYRLPYDPFGLILIACVLTAATIRPGAALGTE
jgi:4-amino-4-deoxy-L-arabinose transferase-like glycosyltransferase